MKVQVRYFASIRESLGVDAEWVDTEAKDAGALLAELRARGGVHAQVLAEGRPVRMAVNQVMARPETALSEAAEVGFFPPVTGG
jgi:molybdopterin synthase sulfur carrier subunit